MHHRCWPFRWPRRCADAIQMALPNAACPGLTPKTTGCHHRATTCSVLPQRPLGQQQTVIGWSYFVQYKGIFGAPNQGQMLYVWQGQTVESGLRCWAQLLNRIWGGRSTTSSPHHHCIPMYVHGIGQTDTSRSMCISLEFRVRYTCIQAR